MLRSHEYAQPFSNIRFSFLSIKTIYAQYEVENYLENTEKYKSLLSVSTADHHCSMYKKTRFEPTTRNYRNR